MTVKTYYPPFTEEETELLRKAYENHEKIFFKEINSISGWREIKYCYDRLALSTENKYRLVDVNKLFSDIYDELELGVRTLNSLKNFGIKTMPDLLSKTEDELIKSRFFAKKSIIELETVLNEKGLSLNGEMTYIQ